MDLGRILEQVDYIKWRALRQVEDFRGAQLHFRGQLVGSHASAQLGVARVPAQVFLVQQLQEIAGIAFGIRRRGARWHQVRDRLIGRERRPLEHRGQKTGRPVRRAHLRYAAGIGNRHECRQFAVNGPEGVADPGSHARKAFEREARVHLRLGGTMCV